MIPPQNPELTDLDRAILQTVVYADVFDYPLRLGEIHRYLTGLSASPEAISARLSVLVPGTLSRCGDYYVLAGREQLVPRRHSREEAASRLWPYALRYGRMITRLPFVRMLAVTGSLAMNNVEETADLDYLVVTATGRLWLCRAMILALGRVAALQGIHLCPNYLISERALEFPDQTLYAAHELAQMVPLSGLGVYERIRAVNPWVAGFLPNAAGVPAVPFQSAMAGPASKIQSVFEAILLTPVGGRLENWEMGRKVRQLYAENRNNPEAGFSADLCKGHSNRHGRRTEHHLREKLERFPVELRP